MVKGNLGLRAEQATIDRLDSVAAALSVKASGATVTRSDVARIALERGLDVLEREIDNTSTKKGTSAASKPKK